MKGPSIDNSGYERAQRAIAEAQAAANNMQKNFQTDLKTENLTTVTPGAAADITTDSSTARRRKPQAGLASSLGLDY